MFQYARHKHFINTYVLHYMRDDTNLSVDAPKYKTDYDILKDEHRYASWESNRGGWPGNICIFSRHRVMRYFIHVSC